MHGTMSLGSTSVNGPGPEFIHQPLGYGRNFHNMLLYPFCVRTVWDERVEMRSIFSFKNIKYSIRIKRVCREDHKPFQLVWQPTFLLRRRAAFSMSVPISAISTKVICS